MPYDRELLEHEKTTILGRLFATKKWGIVTGTQDGRDIERLGIVERLLRKMRSADE